MDGRPRRDSSRYSDGVKSLPAEAWREVEVRDAEKGPLTVAIVTRRVVTMFEEKVGDEELLVVVRWTDEDGTLRHDYHFSNAPADTPLREFARVARAEHRIEQCFERGKTDAGLAEYQVRTWLGWHHHVTLSLLATWFLIGEARRGKKMDARDHGSPSPQTLVPNLARCLRLRYARPHPPRMHSLAAT